ncbi:hypothetical protein B296_00015157 [Ensete ventricosum]|uniref:Uncharacterized protein n=1 Tax=Ensete ventricosum TaxID=4639 RepID=A0A426WZK0_ENSVE|nr:hypothetical protein B296_00015157 [Ensete ventricosum]
MTRAMELQPDDGPSSSLSNGPGFKRCSGILPKFAKRFTEGIGKLVGNMSKKDRKIHRKNAEGYRIDGRVGIGHSPDLSCKSSDELSEGLRRELTMKLSSNSFARESKEVMDDSLSWLYHIRAKPLKVVGKAWHIRESELGGGFILTGRRVDRTLGLTSALTSGVTATYSESASVEVWHEGVVVERGEEATTSLVGLSYLKSKASVRKEVDSKEHHSAAEVDLPIAKEGMQMQGNG